MFSIDSSSEDRIQSLNNIFGARVMTQLLRCCLILLRGCEFCSQHPQGAIHSSVQLLLQQIPAPSFGSSLALFIHSLQKLLFRTESRSSLQTTVVRLHIVQMFSFFVFNNRNYLQKKSIVYIFLSFFLNIHMCTFFFTILLYFLMLSLNK